MTKKADPNVKKYGNPSPSILPRDSKGRFLSIKPSLTKKEKFDRKRYNSVKYYFTRAEHQFVKRVAYAIGASIQAFCASSALQVAHQMAEELAAESGSKIE